MTTAVQSAPLTAAVISVPLILAFKSSSGSAAAPVLQQRLFSLLIVVDDNFLEVVDWLSTVEEEKFGRSNFRAQH